MEEKIRVKKLSNQELLDAEAKVNEFCQKVELDYKETKAKGGQ